MTSQEWVEHVYEVLAENARHRDDDARENSDRSLCVEVVQAIASGEIKGWTTAQKVCWLIAKARKP